VRVEASQISTSYCGPATLPDDLLGRWNFDPILIAAMDLACVSFAVMCRKAAKRESMGFVLSMLTLAIIFISPLCALTVSLFSARVVHHARLVAIAAPLLAMALPRLQRNLASLAFPLLALHTVIFWLWQPRAAPARRGPQRPGTARTMPVATAVVGDALVPAVLAGFHMTAEGSGAASLDLRHDLELVQTQMPGMGGPIGRAGSTEDTGDLDGGAHRLRWAAACLPSAPSTGRAVL